MLRVTVLVSGGGTNLQAILDAQAAGELAGAQIAAVISNNEGAYALTRAAAAGVASAVVSPKAYATREEFHRALLSKVQETGADLVVLAGFLCVIPPEMVEALSEPDHQHPPVPDPVVLRDRLLRAACA